MPVGGQSFRNPTAAALLAAIHCFGLASAAVAQQQVVSHERELPNLRLGQKVLVDDGSCPTGQIKEFTGSSLTASGVTRTTKCVARLQRR
jgi:hypothetical protein